MAEALEDLLRWYVAQCDGDWEHTYGVDIRTLDNPGWTVEIHVEETELAGRDFERMKVERSEHDWLHCWVDVPERPNRDRVRAKAFHGACGPENLTEILRVFLDWAQG